MIYLYVVRERQKDKPNRELVDRCMKKKKKKQGEAIDQSRRYKSTKANNRKKINPHSNPHMSS